MILPGRRRTPDAARYRLVRPSLTAAAQSGNPTQNPSAGRLRRLHQDWQLRALTTYDTVGECWYPSQFYARSLAKTRFFPAILNERGEPEEVETGPLLELWERIRDPGGSGRSDLAASYGRLQFLNGDGYLVVSEQDGEEAWEYLSVAELRIDPSVQRDQPQKYRRLRAPGATQEELAEADDAEFAKLNGSDVRVWRLWRSHPAHSQLADAPIRAILDLYELLHRLTLASAAEATSRAAQRGLLIVADELLAQFVNGPDDDPDEDPFMRALGEALVTAVENPGSAAAMSPIVLRGPGSVPGANGPIGIGELVKWLALGPSDRYLEGEMWEKTITRIGNGLDLPREFLTGMSQGNHWSSWLVDEQGYRQHVAPVTERFCGDLASAYLRPAAKAAAIPNWERVVVGYDPAEAILHPDQIASAKDAHDRLVVSDKFYRDKIGAKDEDAPDQDELERRILILLHRDPLNPSATDPNAGGETAPADGGSGGDTTEQPPAQQDGQQGGQRNGSSRNGSESAAVTAAALKAAKIIGAAEMLVERARERAGAQLVRRSQSCAECKERIELVPQALVAAALGRDQVADLIQGRTTESALIGGVGAGLANKLRTWGIDGEWPDQLGRLVEQHALRTLYEDVPPPLPAAFTAAVAKALR